MEKKIPRKIALNKVTHTVRAAQSVLQYGAGAMVDFPDQTLMTAAPEYWAEKVVRIYDERLQKALHVDFFGMPGGKDDDKFSEGISYVRFPEWYFCPKCREFKPIKEWYKQYKAKATSRMIEFDSYMTKYVECPKCKQDLVAARIVTVCPEGHIDDFPWIQWTHRMNINQNSKNEKNKICSNPQITFKTGNSATEGLEGLILECKTCNAKATLKEAFNTNKLMNLCNDFGYDEFGCTGRHPWKHKKENCSQYPKTIQRGASSVYYPVVLSSLVIPPYSDNVNNKIEESEAFRSCIITIGNVPENMRSIIIENQINEWCHNIALEISIPKDLIMSILKRKWLSEYDPNYNVTDINYRAEEYDALNGSVEVEKFTEGDFEREVKNSGLYNIDSVKSVALIHKMREVRACIGFSRINPTTMTSVKISNANFVNIKDKRLNWYPGYQVRGEGIFIEFDNVRIKNWAENTEGLNERIKEIDKHYNNSFMGKQNPRAITPKFVFLHTLAHLLIRQLSFECGYSIASLRERIYCCDETDGKEMAGILIYTASGDSEGTLGGLVRQGYPDCFPLIFRKAVKSAIICSNDPVCILSHGQGRESLNLASCYSCVLIPETSCEEFNVFLDRGVIVGTFDNHNLGFYNGLAYGN